jgi:hypothetical protein
MVRAKKSSVAIELKECRSCGRKLIFRTDTRSRNGTRRPLEIDGITPHSCLKDSLTEPEQLALAATQLIQEINMRIGGSTVLSLVRHDRDGSH